MIQRKYKGNAREMQRKYNGNTKVIRRKYKGNTKGTQRKYKGIPGNLYAKSAWRGQMFKGGGANMY